MDRKSRVYRRFACPHRDPHGLEMVFLRKERGKRGKH